MLITELQTVDFRVVKLSLMTNFPKQKEAALID